MKTKLLYLWFGFALCSVSSQDPRISAYGSVFQDNEEFTLRQLNPFSSEVSSDNICDQNIGEFTSNQESFTCGMIKSMKKLKRNRLCRRTDIFANCPETCGSKRCPICKDGGGSFRIKGKRRRKRCRDVQSEPSLCSAQLKIRFQGGRTVQHKCPLSCNFCVCDDFDGTFVSKHEPFTCEEIRKRGRGKRNRLCRRKDIFSNCPAACKSERCACKNSRKEFGVEGKGKQSCNNVGSDLYCSDVLNKMYQGGKHVRNRCPLACDFCLDPDQLPSTAPSTSPSESPTTSLAISYCTTSCDDDALALGSSATFVRALQNTAVFGTDIDPDDVDVEVTVDESSCSEGCGGSDRRRLEEGSGGVVNVVTVIKSASKGVFDNVQANILLILDAADEIDGSIVTDAQVKQVPAPSSAPSSAPSPAPSPAPTRAPTSSPQPVVPTQRYLADKLNNFYEGSLNVNNRTSVQTNAPQDDTEVPFFGLEIRMDTENLFERISSLESSVSPLQCQCLNCEVDSVCGGLWRSNKYHVNDRSDGVKVHVVVSHCMSDLYWLANFTAGHDVASFHITSKCGHPVIGAPAGSIIKRLPNVGRCDHSYANFITTELDQVVTSEERDGSILVFLKDDMSIMNMHQSGEWKNFDELINIASSPGGFACGITPGRVKFGSSEFYISSQHDTQTLMEFSMTEYHRNLKGYNEDKLVPFQAPFETLAEWVDYLNPSTLPEIVEVCYGGAFAVSATNIKKQDGLLWKKMEKALSRGNNIQEGHFAERTWASLLGTPLQAYQVESLREYADGVYLNANSMHGALVRRPKVYLHVGVQLSASTELLADSFIAEKETLKDDGYNVAIHGKWDGGSHGFPNVDRLASCMWSGVIRSKFPVYAKEAAACPPDVLSDLTEFFHESVKQSKDVVISNPWLAHPGTADSLAAYLDSGLDAHVVLYYRRYYEWISDVFKTWRDEVRGPVITQKNTSLPVTSLRYIDFLREYCKRLFYGMNTNEDALPIASFRSRITETIIPKGYYLHDFEQKEDVKELTDLMEYTYFAVKQYYSVPRFHRGVIVINYHDTRSPETNFFCHVLPGANGACGQAMRTESVEEDVLLSTTMPGMDPQLVLEDIVLSAYSFGKLRSQYKGGLRLQQQILRWEEMILFALQQNGMSIADFPTECLYPFEVARLLEVSLAYEKELMPIFFESSRGGQNLEQEFREWKFCSVDTQLVLAHEKWNFLFADNLKEEFILPDLPKVYVHVGAPKTGSSSIQDTMALDREVLKQDKFFIAVHGQIEVNVGEFIRDNMLVKCDRIAHCLWTKEEQDAVCVGQTDQRCRCPDYLLPTFDKFLKQAIAEKSEVIVSNEWLQHRTSETGLLSVLKGWQPEIVIYYRRFFDWMISSHFQWHEDFNYDMVKQLEGKVRRVDFFRMFCGRLFGKDKTSGEAIVDLVDIQEYTYQIWTRYHRVPEYRENIRIVDFHSNDVVETFYCDVINAATACKVHKARTAQIGIKQVRKKSSTDLVDLAIGLHFNTRGSRSSSSLDDFRTTSEQIKARLHRQNITEHDLPKECLSEEEVLRLLNVSLAYEELLLPKKYLNGGREAVMRTFEEAQANGEFCSIDTLKIIEDPKFRVLINQ